MDTQWGRMPMIGSKLSYKGASVSPLNYSDDTRAQRQLINIQSRPEDTISLPATQRGVFR